MQYIPVDHERAQAVTEPLHFLHEGLEWKAVKIPGRAVMRIGTDSLPEIDGHIATSIEEYTINVYRMKDEAGYILYLGCRKTGRCNLILETKEARDNTLSDIYEGVVELLAEFEAGFDDFVDPLEEAVNEEALIHGIRNILHG